MVELINASTDVPASPVILRNLVLRVQYAIYSKINSSIYLTNVRAPTG